MLWNDAHLLAGIEKKWHRGGDEFIRYPARADQKARETSENGRNRKDEPALGHVVVTENAQRHWRRSGRRPARCADRRGVRARTQRITFRPREFSLPQQEG